MRSTGTITNADLIADPCDHYLFARLVYPAPTGTLRYTNYPADAVSLDIDGSVQSWSGLRGCDMPELSYGGSAALSHATLNLGNGDYFFADLHNTHGKLRDAEVRVWWAQFNIVVDPADGLKIGAIKDK